MRRILAVIIATLIWVSGAHAQEPGAAAHEPSPDIGTFLNQQQIKNLAVFESTLERWVLLDEDQRKATRLAYERELGVAGQKYVQNQSALQESAEQTQEALGETVESLNETTKEYSEQVGSLERKRQYEVRKPYGDLGIHYHGTLYNHAYANKVAQHATGHYDRHTDSALNYHGTRLNQKLDAADARAEIVDNAYRAEIDATKDAYRAEKKQHDQAIANLEATSRRIDGAMSINNQNRAKAYASLGSFLDRIYQMNDAMKHDYVPIMEPREVVQFHGSHSEEFAPFAIGMSLWRIEWEITNWSSPNDKLTIIVFDAEKKQPFTSVNSSEPYLESFRILDETGVFYLKARVRGNPQFRIRVMEYDVE